MKVKIYCLYNPQNLKIRYIGRTKTLLKKRLSQHICKSKNYKKYNTNQKGSYLINWINSLLKDGIKPRIRLIKVVEGWENSHIEEKNLIKKHFEKHRLVNADDRGPGNCSKNCSKDSEEKRIQNLKKHYSKEENKSQFYNKIYCYNTSGFYIKEYKSSLFACKELSISRSILANHISRFDNYSKNVNPIKGFYFSKFKKSKIEVSKTYQSNHLLIKIKDKKTDEILTFKTMKSFSIFYNLSHWDIHQYRKNTLTKRFKNLLERVEIINAPYN